VDFYTSLLEELGFENIGMLPGGWELVIAHKP
jgi:hypothetical protein